MSRLPTMKGLRVRYGLSQAAEARKLFVSPNTVSKIENHLQTPSPTLVGRICNLFQVAPNKISFQRSLPLPKKDKDYSKSISYDSRLGKGFSQDSDKRSSEKYQIGKVISRNGLLYFCMTKDTFMQETEVLRRATKGLSDAFMEAFSVLASKKYDWNTLYRTAGLSRTAIYKNTSKSKRRKILVEYQLSTLLRLAYVPFQHVNIRKHFNFSIPPEDAKKSVTKALKQYKIDLPKINGVIDAVLHHCVSKQLAQRMGIKVSTLRNYRTSGFNPLSMTFREVVVLIDTYRDFVKRTNTVGVMNMPSGYKYHYIHKNNTTYLLVPLKRAFDVDNALHK